MAFFVKIRRDKLFHVEQLKEKSRIPSNWNAAFSVFSN